MRPIPLPPQLNFQIRGRPSDTLLMQSAESRFLARDLFTPHIRTEMKQLIMATACRYICFWQPRFFLGSFKRPSWQADLILWQLAAQGLQRHYPSPASKQASCHPCLRSITTALSSGPDHQTTYSSRCSLINQTGDLSANCPAPQLPQVLSRQPFRCNIVKVVAPSLGHYQKSALKKQLFQGINTPQEVRTSG
jgi:hypothetical protein